MYPYLHGLGIFLFGFDNYQGDEITLAVNTNNRDRGKRGSVAIVDD